MPYIRLPKRIDAGGGSAEYMAVLYPFTGDAPDVTVERLCDDAGRASGIRVACEGVEDVYLGAAPGYDPRREGSYTCGDLSGTARAAFVRRMDREVLFRKDCE